MLWCFLVVLCTNAQLPDNFQLTLIHTNDVHSHFTQFDERGSPGCGGNVSCYGGAARRATMIKRIRQEKEHVLLLDAGDQNQGTPWYVAYQGDAGGHFMRLLGYDAMALGNHEFDNGVESFVNHFMHNISDSVAILGANIDKSAEPTVNDIINSTAVFEFDGVKVGVVGYITQDTKDISNPGKLEFTDVVDAVKRETTKLRSSGCHIVIGVGHYGYDHDQDMAELVDLDVIIGGHSHTLLWGTDLNDDLDEVDKQRVRGNYPTWKSNVNGRPIPICHVFEFGKYLGHIDINFTRVNDRYIIANETHLTGLPILLDETIEQDADILAEIQKYEKPVNQLTHQHVGTTGVELVGDRSKVRRVETNLGNLLTDAIVNSFNGEPVTMAVQNGGGIRGTVPIGDIDYGHVITVQPFSGTFDLVRLNGSTLHAVFERSVERYDPDSIRGEFLQMSGLRVNYNTSAPPGERVTCLQRLDDNGAYNRIENDSDYFIGVPSFLANGGDGYDMIRDGRTFYHKGRPDTEVFSDEIKRRSPINNDNTGVESRILFNGNECSAVSTTVATTTPSAAFVLVYSLLTVAPGLF